MDPISLVVWAALAWLAFDQFFGFVERKVPFFKRFKLRKRYRSIVPSLVRPLTQPMNRRRQAYWRRRGPSIKRTALKTAVALFVLGFVVFVLGNAFLASNAPPYP